MNWKRLPLNSWHESSLEPRLVAVELGRLASMNERGALHEHSGIASTPIPRSSHVQIARFDKCVEVSYDARLTHVPCSPGSGRGCRASRAAHRFRPHNMTTNSSSIAKPMRVCCYMRLNYEFFPDDPNNAFINLFSGSAQAPRRHVASRRRRRPNGLHGCRRITCITRPTTVSSWVSRSPLVDCLDDHWKWGVCGGRGGWGASGP